MSGVLQESHWEGREGVKIPPAPNGQFSHGSAVAKLRQYLSAAVPHLPGSTNDRIAKLAALAEALRIFGG